jgi:hypothetical protein
LKKYREIEDIIVFGSSVKSKFEPNDLDLAMIIHQTNLSLIGEISSLLPKEAHIESLLPTQIYSTKIGLSIISEGFSIKKNRFLRDMLGIHPKKVYIYSLEGLTNTQKRQFNRALKDHLAAAKADKLGSGSIIVSVEKSGFFEDFLERWNLRFKSKNFNVW